MIIKSLKYIIVSITLIIGFNIYAQKKELPLTRILFIYDASNSMNGSWQSGQKNTIARKLLSNSLDSLAPVKNLEIALRVYGHQKYYKNGQDCDDTKLEVPFSKGNTQAIKDKLLSIHPKGTTPIAQTLEKSAEDFPPCENCRNIIILITDGIEECNGDPCAVALALRKKGITLRPFIIGIGLDVDFIDSFKCIGRFYDVKTESSFQNVLNVVISQALNSTTAQVNLLDENGKPTETDVNMTFYNQIDGEIEYNYIHTINNRGNPDTVNISPVPIYKLVVHTIPPVSKDSIQLEPGKHTIIALDAPQGDLTLNIAGSEPEKNLYAIVRLKDNPNTLNIQSFTKNEKYITGKYDLEILSLPRTYINDVVISQSHTTTVEIPKSGIVTIMSNTYGKGSLYVERNNKLEWFYNLKENSTRETLKLQPGNYRAVFRANNAKESIFTVEKSFTIKSGTSTAIKLF